MKVSQWGAGQSSGMQGQSPGGGLDQSPQKLEKNVHVDIEYMNTK